LKRPIAFEKSVPERLIDGKFNQRRSALLSQIDKGLGDKGFS
jgi:hypothetical protein